MTAIEFAAWVRGVNAALNGAMPSKELWAEVVKEAQGIATPPPAYAPALPDGPLKRAINDIVTPFDRAHPSPPNRRDYILGGAMIQGQN